MDNLRRVLAWLDDGVTMARIADDADAVEIRISARAGSSLYYVVRMPKEDIEVLGALLEEKQKCEE